jgi:ATP-dependent DNA helicase RecG
MWRLYGANGEDKDYEIFKIPFIKVADQVFAKIRNLTYRYLPNQLSLFPKQTEQYDQWLLRELLNNCMAHANYQLGGRIYINEFEDKISFTNPGDFLPQNIEAVLQTSYNPPFYRNQLLAESMANFHMIDTAAMGIRKVFRIQKEKYFPMPDYDFSNNQVGVTVYGKILDDKYTQLLFRQPDLDLETVYLLDRVQKKLKLSKEAVSCLRRYKLIEGRVPNLFISELVAQEVKEEAQYIRNKAFDDKYYKDLIVKYIATYGRANRNDIRKLLWDKLSDVLKDEQKESKIKNLLQSMRRSGVIVPDVENSKKAYWILSVKV